MAPEQPPSRWHVVAACIGCRRRKDIAGYVLRRRQCIIAHGRRLQRALAACTMVAGHILRLQDQKRKAVEAFQRLNFRVIAIGDLGGASC